MTWLMNTALAALRWGWGRLSVAGNYVVDPPPMHLKMLFWIAVAGAVGYWVVLKPGAAWVGREMLEMVWSSEPEPKPMYLVPRTVITTIPPAVKEADTDTLAEAPKPPEKAAKKRRVKVAKKPATEAYWPF